MGIKRQPRPDLLLRFVECRVSSVATLSTFRTASKPLGLKRSIQPIGKPFLNTPQQYPIHGMDRTGNEAVVSPQAPKPHQNFIKKRVAPILFYKFFKFRANFAFVFNTLRLYKWEMGTGKWEMGTGKWEMGTKSRIDKWIKTHL
jgi:hypothetical protein